MALYMTISLPDVQTYIVQRLTNILSENLHAKVSIGSVNYEFFSKLAVNQLYVEDKGGDTLMYVDKLGVSVTHIGLMSGSIQLGTVRLTDGEFNLRITDSTTNISELVNELSKPKIDTVAKRKGNTFSIGVSNVELSNFRFSMQRTPKQEYTDSARINFTDMHVDNIYLDIHKIKLKSDTLFFDIDRLSLHEQSGFRINKISANAYVCGSQAMLKNLRVTDDYSDLQFGYFSMNFTSSKDLKYFIQKIRMDAKVTDGYVSFKTIGYFAPRLSHIATPLAPKGFVTGTVDNLKSDSLYIATRDGKVNLLLRFRMMGLPLIDETSIHADVKNLYADSQAALNLYDDISNGKSAALRPYIAPLHIINFRGKFTGLYNDFVANGELRTGIGTLDVDALFAAQKANTMFKGRFRGLDCFIGQLAKAPILGKASFDLQLEGVLSQKKGISTQVEGQVSQLELNGYRYSGISLGGRLESNTFDGRVAVDDPNLQLSFLGKINNFGNTDSIPYANFTAGIEHANLAVLKLNKRDSVSLFKGNVVADFRGHSWNDGAGRITLSNARYTDSKGSIELGDIHLSIEQGKRSYNLQLLSEYLDATFKGTSGPGSFTADLLRLLHGSLPNATVRLNMPGNGQDNTDDSYNIRIATKKTGDIARIFIPDFYVSENSTIRLELANNHLLLGAKADKLYYGSYQVKGLNLNVDGADSLITATITGKEVNNGGSLFMRSLKVDNKADNNRITTTISYNNETKERNIGNLTLHTLFAKRGERVVTEFDIAPSLLVLNDVPWDISCKQVLLDSALFNINRFEVHNEGQRLIVNGAYATHGDTLLVTMDNFRLSGIDYLLVQQGYAFSGSVTARATIVKQLEGVPLFFANVQATDVTVNKYPLGNLSLRSRWNQLLQRIDVNLNIANGGQSLLDVRGGFTPKQTRFDLVATPNNLPLRIVEPFMKSVASKLEGDLTGNYRFEGSPGSLKLTGSGMLSNGGATINVLNTHYTINGKVLAEVNKFSMSDAEIKDSEGHTGTLNATATHRFFKRFYFDADMKVNNFQGLNTTANDSDMYYGTAYATGTVSMKGNIDNLRLRVDATTNKNTAIYIPLPTAMASKGVGELLTFYVPPPPKLDSLAEDEQRFLSAIVEKRNVSTVARKSNLNLQLNIDATSDAQLQVIVDPQTNDVLTGAGRGRLQMEVSPAQNLFKLYGRYTLDKGSYTLSIPTLNFIKKTFLIDKGGTVDFNGDLTQMSLNLTATYDKTLRASLLPVLPDTLLYGKTRYPIILQIGITGSIYQLNIKPIIDVQNIDSDTEAKLKSVMNTDEKLFNQFIFLLAFSQFTSDQSSNQGNMGSVAGLSGLSDLISGQLSALLSGLNLPIDFGLNTKIDEATGQQEFDVDFSGRINDKMQVRGSIGNSNNPQNGNNVAGDFDFSYQLTPSVVLKAFSHSSDPYTDQQGGSRYGGAISYQNRFATFKDLWNSIFKSKKKRQAEAEAKAAADTTKNKK